MPESSIQPKPAEPGWGTARSRITQDFGFANCGSFVPDQQVGGVYP